MRKISLFFLFAFLSFLVVLDDTATGETFASVDLYISGEPNGQLRVEDPSGSSTESVVIADGESGQGTFQEVGRWTTTSLQSESNISGEWSGKAWVSSNRDASVTLRYTIIQNDNNLDEFEFSGDVNTGETAQLSGSSDFSLKGLDESSLTLLVESSWTAQPGSAPPPPTEGNTTITFDYGTDSSDTKVTIPISHLRMTSGSSPSLITGQSEFYVYVEVSDVFGVDDVISLSTSDYSMQMGPSGDSPWSSDVDKVSDKGDYVEVRFLWSFEGHTLPAGENTYNIEVDTTDLLSDLSWSKNLQTTIYVEPEPNAEIEAITSTSKVVEFGKTAIYTLSVRNSGSGGDEFIITYDNSDNWDVSIDIYDLELDAGDSQNIKVSIMPSDSASDGEESPTIITVTAASDSGVYDTVTLITTAKEPEPDWDFSISIDEEGNENYDYSSDSFIIKDREPLIITFSVTNIGNGQNSFNLKFISIDNAFSSNFDRSSLSSVSPNQNEIVVLTLTPRNDYYGTNTFVEIEVTSSGDSKKKIETVEVFLEQSGNILGPSNLKLEVSLGKSQTHTLKITNLDIDEGNRIYFHVSGVNDQLAETWVSFKNKDGEIIDSIHPFTLLPSQTVEVTLIITIPPSGVNLGSYEFNIWMENEQRIRISEQYNFEIVTTISEDSTESNFLLYGVFSVALGGVLLYGYRNFNNYDEEDYEDYDELEDLPEFIDEFPSSDENIIPEPVPQAVVPEPVPQAVVPEPVPQAVVSPAEAPPSMAAIPQSETPVKPKKKWFGLFGKSDQVSDVEPVAAEPVVAQLMAAEPVVAQPVVAEPVVAQPVVAEPVVAQPVAAEPVVAQPVVAEPVVAQPVVAEPVVAQPVVAEPVVAQPVAAEPVVVQAVVIPDPEE